MRVGAHQPASMRRRSIRRETHDGHAVCACNIAAALANEMRGVGVAGAQALLRAEAQPERRPALMSSLIEAAKKIDS